MQKIYTRIDRPSGFSLVAVINLLQNGRPFSWAVYQDLSIHSTEEIANWGDKISQTDGEKCFPEIAMKNIPWRI